MGFNTFYAQTVVFVGDLAWLLTLKAYFTFMCKPAQPEQTKVIISKVQL
jgi:hypothetical protein